MNLTLEALDAAIEQVKPTMWYAIAAYLPDDVAYRIEANDYYPEVWLFSWRVFAETAAELSCRFRLRHIANYRTEK
jgi:hypothetical protein